MTGRADRAVEFLTRAGWGSAARAALAGDASFRRYERLTDQGTGGGERRAILMDAPPPQEDVRPFLTVARLLRQMGFSAPRILAEDATAGFLLLEDFGDRTYTRLLGEGADETGLYSLAVDVLIALHRGFDAMRYGGVPAYDDAKLLGEAALLVDWYLPALTGQSTPPELRDDYLATWRTLLPLAQSMPATLVLRDYHVDNLMLLDGRAGLAACGLLDFQDAVIGSPAYDLVSLVEDARRDISPTLAAAMIERYLLAFPEFDRADFHAVSSLLAVQRNCKIIGIFTRLWRRDGKPGYLVHIPRVWRLVERDIAHPALAPIKHWLDRHIPPGRRRMPAFQDGT